jgi:uncharacterized protein (TIGR02246 family)
MKGSANLAILFSLALLLLPTRVSGQEPRADLREEKQALRAVIDQVLVFYENRDGEGMAGLCDDPFMTLGSVFRSQENIQRFWAFFLGNLGDVRMTILEELDPEFVTPEVAIVQTRIEFSNFPPDAAGSPQPPREVWAANVYVKKDGRWMRKGAFLG